MRAALKEALVEDTYHATFLPTQTAGWSENGSLIGIALSGISASTTASYTRRKVNIPLPTGSGYFYVEALQTDYNNSGNYTGGIGLANSTNVSSTSQTARAGADGNCVMQTAFNTVWRMYTSSLTSQQTGQTSQERVLGMLIDLDAGDIWFNKTDTATGTTLWASSTANSPTSTADLANPAVTGVDLTTFAHLTLFMNAQGVGFKLNFGDDPTFGGSATPVATNNTYWYADLPDEFFTEHRFRGMLSLDEAGIEVPSTDDYPQLNWGGIIGRDVIVSNSLVDTGVLTLGEHGARVIPGPPAVSGAASFSIAENTSTSTVLATYAATNLPVTWSVTGTDASNFNINSSGQLTFAVSPDHETAADRSQSINVVATNALGSGSQAVSITVTDVFFETGTYIGAPTSGQLSTYNNQKSNIGGNFDVAVGDDDYLFLMHLNEPNDGDLSYFVVRLSNGQFYNSGNYYTQSLPTISSGLGSASQHGVIEHVWLVGNKFYVLSNTATHNGYSAPCLYSDGYGSDGSTFDLLGQVGNWPGGTTGLDIATTRIGNNHNDPQLFVMKGGTTGDPEFIEISGIDPDTGSPDAGSVVNSGLSITNLPTGFDVSEGIAYMDGPNPDRFIFGGSGDLVTVTEYDPPSNLANVVSTQSWDDLGDLVSFSGFSFRPSFTDAITGDDDYLYYWHEDSSYSTDYKLYRFSA